MDLVFARRRRLHFEQLESKIAPGALLWGAAGLGLGLSAEDTFSDIVTPQPTDNNTAKAVPTWPRLSETRFSNDDLFAVLASAHQAEAARSNAITSNIGRDTPHRAIPQTASPLSMNVLAATAQPHGPSNADAPILKSLGLPQSQNAGSSGSGGGGGSNSGQSGGAAGGAGSANGHANGAAATGSASAPATSSGGTNSASAPMASAAAAAALGVDDADHTSCHNKASDANTASQLTLVDANGAPIALAMDGNTIVIGVASWCPHCAELEMTLRDPAAQSALSGLRIIFAFDNEGGTGPGGVRDADVLGNLPGEAAFLATDSLRPAAFPNAFDPTTGQFNADPYDAISTWYAARVAQATSNVQTVPSQPQQTLANPQTGAGAGQEDAPGSGTDVTIPGDFNGDFHVDAADYIVWRKTFGQTGLNLPADGNGDQVVDQLDYDIWRAHYGDVQTLPGAFAITGPNGTQTQSSVTVTWSTSTLATSYEVVVSNNADLSSPVSDQVVSTTSIGLNLTDGNYYVGVTASNASGTTVAGNQPFFFNVLHPVDQVIFVTSVKYSIATNNAYPPSGTSFGSVGAADYQCSNLANNAGLLDSPWDFQTLVFRALVTEATVDITTRAGLGNNKYYNTAGQVVANSRDDLLSGNFSAPILTQQGLALTGAQGVWTGALPNGNASGNSCTNWSSTSGVANSGNVNGTGTNWLDQAAITCLTQQRLYCVGVKKSS
jgi:hypothetical protein